MLPCGKAEYLPKPISAEPPGPPSASNAARMLRAELDLRHAFAERRQRGAKRLDGDVVRRAA